MDPATLAATEASLKHWRKNAKAETLTGANVHGSKCALCAMFWCEDCAGCPIAQKTGEAECGGGPYPDANRAYYAWVDGKGTREAFHVAATAMADFIEAIIKEAEGV